MGRGPAGGVDPHRPRAEFQAGIAEIQNLLALARRLRRGRLGRRLALAAGLFWAFLWLSPQVYYAYYQLIFDGLPVQIVIGWPPGAETVLRRLAFAGPATLAAHGQGVLGWVLLVGAVRRFRWL